MDVRLIVGGECCLALPRHVKLKEDKVRARWVMQAPERILVPDDTALEIVRMLDGASSVEAIVAKLVAKYQAPAEVIRPDVIAMLQDLADKGFVVEAGSIGAAQPPREATS